MQYYSSGNRFYCQLIPGNERSAFYKTQRSKRKKSNKINDFEVKMYKNVEINPFLLDKHSI